LDAIGDGAVLMNMRGKIIYANRAVEKISGYSPNEVVGRGVFSLAKKAVGRREYPAVLKVMRATFGGKFSNPFIFSITGKDGRKVCLSGTASFLRKESSVFLLGVFKDVTALKEAEAKLKDSEERYKALFDRSSHYIYIFDFNGRFVDVNQAALDLLGYKKNELLKVDIASLMADDQSFDMTKVITEIKKRGFYLNGGAHRYKIKKKNGDIVWLEAESSLIMRNGEPYAVQGVARDITERVTAEKELKGSETLYRTLLDTIPSAVTATDLKGNIIAVSQRMLELHGFKTKEEVLGKNVFSLLAARERKRAGENMKRILREGVVRGQEFFLKRKDGGEFIAEMSASLIRDCAGRPQMFIGAVRDITRRKSIETALRESEEKYRTVVESSPNCVCLLEKKGEILFINEVGQKEFGVNCKNHNSGWKNLLGCMNPEGRAAFSRALAMAARGKKGQAEFAYRRKKSASKIFVSTFVPIKDAGKKVAQILMVSRDISVSEKAKKQLEKQAGDLEKFRMAVDHASDMIIITDPEGRILYANRAVEEEIGCSRKELIGQKAGGKENWGGEMGRDFYDKMWKTIREDKETFVGEVTNRRKSGEKYIAEISISPVLDNRDKVLFFVGIERDITRAKEVDRAKSEFVSLASHQLRTPLTSMSLSVQMFLRGAFGEMTAEQKAGIDSIFEDIDAMSELIGTLLNVSKLETGTFRAEYRPVDVKDVAEEVIRESQPQILEKKIKFGNKYAANLPRIKTDRSVIKAVLQNLIVNAVKYTPERGRIELKLKKRAGDFMITVRDTGYGIPESDRPRIFTKFFRARNIIRKSTSGTGLGLYLSKALLAAVGGQIFFESKENKGTTFYVLLPAAEKKNNNES